MSRSVLTIKPVGLQAPVFPHSSVAPVTLVATVALSFRHTLQHVEFLCHFTALSSKCSDDKPIVKRLDQSQMFVVVVLFVDLWTCLVNYSSVNSADWRRLLIKVSLTEDLLCPILYTDHELHNGKLSFHFGEQQSMQISGLLLLLLTSSE